MKPTVKFKITATLHRKILDDLRRPHKFALERIGFLYTNSKRFSDGSIIIYASSYEPLADENYIADPSSCATINSSSIRKAMQGILNYNMGCFHVHLHNHTGDTSPSITDLKGGVPEIISSFASLDPLNTHGVIIFSADSIYINLKLENLNQWIRPDVCSIVGYPMTFILSKAGKLQESELHKRQSFLGKKSPLLLQNVRVGIVGFGGGGSHVGQQLAHIGLVNITVFDGDKIELSNLNRLIGAWFSDIRKVMLKIKIAERLIKKILPKARLVCVADDWKNKAEILQQCDIIVGCVDTLIGRRELENECRRYLIPYIDIGMDVNTFEDGPYMTGQVLMSMPGSSCFKCFKFIKEEDLAEEAKKYGDVGGLPQVVWPNGILASSAVGIVMDIITGWTGQKSRRPYFAYDGNLGTLVEHARAEFAPKKCTHFNADQVGPVKFKKL